ncbi:MAG: DUF29 domain-containing protein [Caldilineaceae bacterium]
MSTATLYDTDLYAWTQEQANLLRQGQLAQLDIANLVEEIEDMGKSQQRQLESRLVILLAHLLKWHYQPERRSRSWEATLRVQRIQLQKLLKQNPSLRAQLADFIADAYEQAINLAWAETGLDFDIFPALCPYTVQDVLDSAFFPEG